LFGIPVTRPTRTLFDLSGELPAGKLELTVDRALSRRLTTPALLGAGLDDLARRGRRRIEVMRQIISVRGEGYRPPESGLESRFQKLAEKAGYAFDRQVEMGDENEWLARVDFRSRSEPLVVEVNGDAFHTALVDRRRDAARIAALEAAGLVVAVVREHDVWHDPRRVINLLHEAHAAARRLRRSA
jgi:very-short-patch-repair endonuclease